MNRAPFQPRLIPHTFRLCFSLKKTVNRTCKTISIKPLNIQMMRLITLLQVSFGLNPSQFLPWMLPRHCPSLPLRRWVTAWFSRLRAMLNS